MLAILMKTGGKKVDVLGNTIFKDCSHTSTGSAGIFETHEASAHSSAVAWLSPAPASRIVSFA
jgi:hypothetical protein